MANQAVTAELAAKAWFDRRFKKHRLLTSVVCTAFNQDGKLQTTMNIFNTLLDMSTKVTIVAQGVNNPLSIWLPHLIGPSGM